MLGSRHSPPILIPLAHDEAPKVLSQVAMGSAVGDGGYDESFLQDVVFRHPQSLPIGEIDRSFLGAVPVCREMRLPSGFVDAFLVTSTGLPVLVECKLWRNPQARREVIGQILDYAKDLGRMGYSDLQSAVSQRLGETGNALYARVARTYPDVDESEFVDAVARNLRRGRFLLLIVGDGIREGVEAITEYVQEQSGLHFTLGLVEMPVFKLPSGDRLVAPRVLARTAVLNRTVVDLRSAELTLTEDEAESAQQPHRPENIERGDELEAFWTEFLSELTLDDPEQPVPSASRGPNLFFRLPVPGGRLLWLATYRVASGEVGVFVSCRRGSVGQAILQRLVSNPATLEDELGAGTSWTKTESWPYASHSCGDFADPGKRTEALSWLRTVLNRYVNVFRPRVKEIVANMDL